MRFKATTTQLLRIIANAVNATPPSGLGSEHCSGRYWQPEELEHLLLGDHDQPTDQIDIAFVDWRVIMLLFMRVGEGEFEVSPKTFNQGWLQGYPTVEALVESAIGDRCSCV